MPAASSLVAGRKRKRSSEPRAKVFASVNWKDTISQAEKRIAQSQKNYNEIADLFAIVKDDENDGESEKARFALVSLFRVFCRLIATGSLSTSKVSSDSKIIVITWLKQKFKEFEELLLEKLLETDDAEARSTYLDLCMRLIKQQIQDQSQSSWRHSSFPKLLNAFLRSSPSKGIPVMFGDKYFSKYVDVQHYTFLTILAVVKSNDDDFSEETPFENSFAIMSSIEIIPTSADDHAEYYCGTPSGQNNPLQSLPARKKQAQQAWLAFLKLPMNKSQRKRTLRIMTLGIIPWFSNAELLMDFLTDSYDAGGSISLLALSGLFHLMQEKNLDYPSFFPKLYSLLDQDLLHSKHRSRFFRLLDTFMSSTHLPAVLIASFIKRLSRLALHSPPAGIVAVIPWIYNILKRHPACTFMIHRECLDEEQRQEIEECGVKDPFDMSETDPMRTNAIDSSLWEIVTLQSHYHPNVATLAKIISEPFTKQSYKLEDFLDYSYTSIIEGDLRKEMKKPPVIEDEIPKRIFTAEEGLSQCGKLLEMLRGSEDDITA